MDGSESGSPSVWLSLMRGSKGVAMGLQSVSLAYSSKSRAYFLYDIASPLGIPKKFYDKIIM